MLKQRILFFENLNRTRQSIDNTVTQKPSSNQIDGNVGEIGHTPSYENYRISFGLNDFSLDSDDNFIVEAINENGLELNYIFIKVTRFPSFDRKRQKPFKSVELKANKEQLDSKSEEEQCFGVTHLQNVNEPKSDHFEMTVDIENSENRNENSVYDEIQSISSAIYDDLSEYAKSVQTEHKKQTRLKFIIEELVSTEESYLIRLTQFIDWYKEKLEKIDETLSRIFSSILIIHDLSKSFLEDLKRNLEDPDKIAEIFLNSESLFDSYPPYAICRHRISFYLDQHEEVIKDVDELNDGGIQFTFYLHSPIQRLGQYALFLENIQKELIKMQEPHEKVLAALNLVKIKMKKCNDLLVIDSIKNSPIDLKTKGVFITKEKFNMIEPNKLECSVFLFEQILVFCQEEVSDKYLYLDHIDLEDIRPNTSHTDSKRLSFQNYTKFKKDAGSSSTFVLEAKDAKIKKCWLEITEKLLWSQLERAKAEQINKNNKFSDIAHDYIRTSKTKNIFVESFQETLEFVENGA